MKKTRTIPRTQRCLTAVVLTSLAVALSAHAAAIPLTGQLISQPVTPNNVATYSLPANTAYSGGLSTVGVGVPVNLELDMNIALPASGITNVTFMLASKPPGSSAVIGATLLPTNMGVFLPSDQLVYQVAGRATLQPDVTGQYVVTATVYTATNGTTNFTYNVSAATYLGVQVCELCHSGGVVAEEEYQYWTNTAHAMIFTEGINGVLGAGYSVSCLKCHTVGYNTNAASLADNGFYSTQLQDNWSFPKVLTNSNFANMPPNLQNLGNIQCENCHGPGSEHAYAFGNTNVSNWPRLTVTHLAGACEQCHDDPTHHYYGTQWYASKHAVTTTIPSGAGHGYCVQCHTTAGFITRINYTGTNATQFAPTNTIDTTFTAIGCQTCHEPHGNTIPSSNVHLIRTLASVTMGDGSVITNAGEGTLCLECHHSRDGSATNNVVQYPIGGNTWVGGSSFGPHDGVQGDMIEGVNAITYGQSIPSSAHRHTVTNLCVGCHMQAVGPGDPAFLQAGGHTFEMSYNVTNSGVVTKVDKTDVCAQCHGTLTTFDFPVEDYANTGTIQGVQTEVQILLNQLSTLLPNSSGKLDGLVKSSLSVKTSWTTAQLQAAYDWQFVANDGSLGIHNAPFATGILKASIANLSGTSVPGGLPDAWEMAYFGSITNSSGAPDADPTGDGIPNWLKYTLGLNPNVAGLQVPGGVVYANGTSLGGNGTNMLEIYNAAQLSFNTVSGTTYQLQEVNNLSGGWQNIGGPVVATNSGAYSYLTPMRGNAQQFFRVVHTP